MIRRFSVWSITWLSLVGVAATSVAVLASLSYAVAHEALVRSLEDHVTAQAGLAAASVRDLPLEVLVTVGGQRSQATVEDRLQRLRDAGRLHDVALIGPDDAVLGSGGDWLPGRAEADLIAAGRSDAIAGPLYTAIGGERFMTAYAPVPEHPGWVVAVEGSGATLSAADRLAWNQLLSGLALVLLVSAVAFAVAAALSRPLQRLDQQLAALQPGDGPERVEAGGPREVRRIGQTVAALLSAIRERDSAIAQAHTARMEELTRLAAGVAHEIRNPLNAMSLTAQRMQRMSAGERRDRLAVRLQDQAGQLEVIVQRLVDLTSPIDPDLESLALAGLIADAAAESTVPVEVTGDARAIRGDRVMLLQVFRNLFLNASQAGATRIAVALEPAGTGVLATVIDDGPGLAEPEGAFAWFHTTRAAGSGLGLPQSRRLVEAMGGRLELRAARPATFSLWMPCP